MIYSIFFLVSELGLIILYYIYYFWDIIFTDFIFTINILSMPYIINYVSIYKWWMYSFV